MLFSFRVSSSMLIRSMSCVTATFDTLSKRESRVRCHFVNARTSKIREEIRK
jgi:hypothetical protein